MGRRRRLIPLVLATLATQAGIVVLAPLVVEIGHSLHASVGAVGQARAILAITAVAASLAIGPLIDRVGVRPLIMAGGAFALAGAGLASAAPSLPAFYAAQVPTGLGVACLLTAGFAGVGAWFDEGDTGWAMGYVVGAQSLAWIVGNPVIGLLDDAVSWRLSYVVPATAALLALLGGLLLAPTQRVRVEAPGGLLSVLRDRSARRWAIAELVAYAAWTAELTYAGAFYIETYGVSESAVGFLLAGGSVFFLIGTLATDRLARNFGRKPMVVLAAAAMGGMLALILNVTPSVWFTLGLFCLMAFFAAWRTTGSSSMGLHQLPGRPGSMMAARTGSAQLGYTAGALAGGVVLAISGYGALGFVLLGGMLLSAVLFARVHDPEGEPAAPERRLPAPVPD